MTSSGDLTWFVYILQSDTTGKLYTGITNNLPRRLREHNGGPRGAKATRFGRPWQLVFTEPQESKIHAMRRERSIKKCTRAQKLALIERHSEVVELATG